MNVESEEDRDRLDDFMSKISYLMLEEIDRLKKEFLSEEQILNFLIENFKHNVARSPEAALEMQFDDRKP